MEILHGTVLSTLNLEKNLQLNPWCLETLVRQARPWGVKEAWLDPSTLAFNSWGTQESHQPARASTPSSVI